MMLRTAASRLPAFLPGVVSLICYAGTHSSPSSFAVAASEFEAVPSPGNAVHFEQDVDIESIGKTIDITSNVPVTISRYTDMGMLSGAVPPSMAKVVVTSDCGSDETDVIPEVTISAGSIGVNVDVPDDEASAMKFLQPSSFSAFWTYVSGMCGFSSETGEPDTPGTVETKCLVGGATCGDGYYCQAEAGTCGGGVCLPKPEACMASWEPVCGCDGKTHSNDCDAGAAGASVSYKGECVASDVSTDPTAITDPTALIEAVVCEAGHDADPKACGPDKFCKLKSGVCTPDGIYDGVCQTKPEVCIEMYAPVCGCDGVTHDNDCYAELAGTSVSYEGECNSVDPTDVGTPPTAFALIVKATCEEGAPCSVVGSTCSTGTETCCGQVFDSSKCSCTDMGDGTLQYDSCFQTEACMVPPCCASGPPKGTGPPADGTCTPGGLCDTGIEDDYCCVDIFGGSGGTYCSISGGAATVAGDVSTDPTALIEAVACRAGPDADQNACGEGNFCKLKAGVCTPEGGTYEGVCQQISEACPMSFVPVCSCDGTTYSNDCVAASAGASVSYEGECFASDVSTDPTALTEAVACRAGPDADQNACGEGNFCELKAGVCTPEGGTYEGVCQQIPEACPLSFLPVCSCDGTTYSNDCAAASAGASVSYKGECVASDVSTDPTALIEAVACQAGPDADQNACGEGNFCELKAGVCTPDGGIYEGVCQQIPEACPMSFVPVCSCNGTTYSNNCVAASAGASVSYKGECVTGDVSTDPTVLIEAVVCEAGPDADPNACGEGNFCELKAGVCTQDGSTYEGVCQPIPEACPMSLIPVCSCNGTTYSNDCVAASAGASISYEGECGAESTSTITATSTPPTPSPIPLFEQPKTDQATDPNSAFNRPRSFSFRAAITLITIVAISLIFPGGNSGNNLWGFGKFAVAALAVSSLHFESGNIRKGNTKGPGNSKNRRTLQKTCTFNVEVLIDGCNHPLEISAPSGRVVDVVIENMTQSEQPDNPCAVDYEANLTFPVTDSTMELSPPNMVLLPFDGNSPQCLKPMEGRPFIDVTGGSLQAVPWVPYDESESVAAALSWTGEALVETQVTYASNATARGQYLLGEEWIRRAIGEHASVASFSAFTIALMTNQAPSHLVDDALKAGLDEVRHARTSFDIASKLTGKVVVPGPLPESKFEFGQDLEALALAVAREGCLDETLSAFVAALEVEHISAVLAGGVKNSIYSNIGHDVLAFIRDELTTIAVDESNHSGLAWRSLNWVCSIDSVVCENVHQSVFEESNLELRFNQRAESSFGESSHALLVMREEWTKIFHAHLLGHSGQEDNVLESICVEADTAKDNQSGQPLVASVTKNILHQVVCG